MPYADPAKKSEYNRKYRLAHHEESIVRSKLWREENTERHRENARKWATNNRERCRNNHSNWRKRNPELNATYYRRLCERARIEWRALVAELVCEECGSHARQTEKYCGLDFHHRDPKSRSFSVGAGFYKVARDRLLAEMEKCDILCRSCHKHRHFAMKRQLKETP